MNSNINQQQNQQMSTAQQTSRPQSQTGQLQPNTSPVFNNSSNTQIKPGVNNSLGGFNNQLKVTIPDSFQPPSQTHYPRRNTITAGSGYRPQIAPDDTPNNKPSFSGSSPTPQTPNSAPRANFQDLSNSQNAQNNLNVQAAGNDYDLNQRTRVRRQSEMPRVSPNNPPNQQQMTQQQYQQWVMMQQAQGKNVGFQQPNQTQYRQQPNQTTPQQQPNAQNPTSNIQNGRQFQSPQQRFQQSQYQTQPGQMLPNQQLPNQQPPNQQLPNQQPSNQQLPNQQPPNQQPPNQQPPNQQPPNQQLPNQQPPNQQLPNQQLPNQQLPNQQLPNQQLPNQQLPNQQLPNQQLPNQMRPGPSQVRPQNPGQPMNQQQMNQQRGPQPNQPRPQTNPQAQQINPNTPNYQGQQPNQPFSQPPMKVQISPINSPRPQQMYPNSQVRIQPGQQPPQSNQPRLQPGQQFPPNYRGQMPPNQQQFYQRPRRQTTKTFQGIAPGIVSQRPPQPREYNGPPVGANFTPGTAGFDRRPLNQRNPNQPPTAIQRPPGTNGQMSPPTQSAMPTNQMKPPAIPQNQMNQQNQLNQPKTSPLPPAPSSPTASPPALQTSNASSPSSDSQEPLPGSIKEAEDPFGKRISFDESAAELFDSTKESNEDLNGSDQSFKKDDEKGEEKEKAELFGLSTQDDMSIKKDIENMTKKKGRLFIDEVIDDTYLNKFLNQPINDEQCKKDDAAVKKICDELKPKKLQWFSSYVHSCESEENPYSDHLAVEYSLNPEVSDNRVVKLFSEKTRHLKLGPVQEVIPPQLFNQPSPDTFLYEVMATLDKSKVLPIKKKPVPAPQNSYVRQFKQDDKIFVVKDNPPQALPKRKFLNLQLVSQEFKMDKVALEKVEPFFLCGYLVYNGEIISEQWYFCPSETGQFVSDIKTNSKGSFELPNLQSYSEVYFVVLLLRKLLPENGAAINKYYKSPGTKTLQSAKEQAKFRTAYPNIFAPLAWTFIDVETIIKSKNPFKMPQPYYITGMIKPLYRSLKSVSGQQLPLDLSFTMQLQPEITRPYELTFSNNCVMQSLIPPPEVPCLSFSHTFYIRIISVSLHTKKRNIYAHISLRKGETELPLINYAYRDGKSNRGFTKCWHHEKKPIFDDIFSICLPNPIPPDFMIYIKFFNAVLKNLTTTGKTPATIPSIINDQEPNPSTSELIGITKIPLINAEGNFLEDGIQNYSVFHVTEGQNIPSCLTLETRLDSSLISSSPMLNKFYNKIDTETMVKIDANDAVINLFNLLDELVVGMITQPEESLKSLVELSRKVSKSQKTDFSAFAVKYASSFAFRTKETTNPSFHRNLLHNWALLIEADAKHKIQMSQQNQANADQSNNNNNSNGNISLSSNPLSMSNLSLSSPNMGVPSTRMSRSSSFSLLSSNQSNQQKPHSESPEFNGNLDNSKGSGGDSNENLKVTNSGSFSMLSSENINKIQADTRIVQNSDRSDYYLIDFFFILIIKSLYLTNDHDFGKEFTEFLISWSNNFNKDQINSYSTFINLLFDIGHYSYACSAITKQATSIILSKQSSDLLLTFLQQVLRPRLFYPSIVVLDDFVKLIQTMIMYSRNHKVIFDGIYNILLRIFIHYNEEMNKEVTMQLINTYTILRHFDKFGVQSDSHSVFYFYSYLLQSTTYEAFQKFIVNNKYTVIASFFVTLETLINYVKGKELARILHFSVLNVLTHAIRTKTKQFILYSMYIGYNLLCKDLAVDFLPELVKFYTKIIQLYYNKVLYESKPPMTKIIAKLFRVSFICPNEFNDFLKALFNSDTKEYGNTRRSMSMCCRGLFLIMNLNDVSVSPDSPLDPILKTLKEYEKFHKEKISEEYWMELKFKRALCMFHSPDVAIQCLESLISYNQEKEYFEEELQARIFKIAFVFEYLSRKIEYNSAKDEKENKKFSMNIDYLFLERPSLMFADLCPMVKDYIKCPEDGNFRLQSYCDSECFSENWLIKEILAFINRCVETKLFEMGIQMIDKFWPLIEHRNNFSLISNTFKTFSLCYSEIAAIPPEIDRLFGRYFRVSFYGDCFMERNGVSYIYRELKLTHLFEVSKRLTDFYSDTYKCEIELIKEAGSVDPSTLDIHHKGYIQVTFVEPLFQKTESKERVTPYEKAHLLKNFFFDTPFTKEGKKAQSTIDQQWIRRTVLTVESEMPSICKRVKIIKVNEKEFAPIRVAYRQLRERILMLENAISQCDYRNIQQLLHGSLLVQVNEGPSRMAELFLAEDYEKSKYTEKMKNAFKLFLEVNGKALDMHAKWVTDNPAFVPLQHELESGLTSLTEKLSIYI